MHKSCIQGDTAGKDDSATDNACLAAEEGKIEYEPKQWRTKDDFTIYN